ncbi:unnamed protein product [Heterobilharzia americana]|nr:unnamed protein product [Heterobilharzia americana]
MPIISILQASPFIAVPYIGAFINQRTVYRNLSWHRKLKRPSFSPPRWTFAPIWYTLYGCMGVASYLVWRDAVQEEALLPLAVYGFQLLLNWSWIHIFFGRHKLKHGAAVILGVLSGAGACVCLFRPISVNASNLMIPYALWLTYASIVNLRTAMLNDCD